MNAWMAVEVQRVSDELNTHAEVINKRHLSLHKKLTNVLFALNASAENRVIATYGPKHSRKHMGAPCCVFGRSTVSRNNGHYIDAMQAKVGRQSLEIAKHRANPSKTKHSEARLESQFRNYEMELFVHSAQTRFFGVAPVAQVYLIHANNWRCCRCLASSGHNVNV